MATRSSSPNARIAAVTPAFAAFLTLVLTHTSMAVAPLRILAASLAAFMYSAFLVLSILFWSVAFLHRQRELKRAGAVGFLWRGYIDRAPTTTPQSA